MLCVHLNSITEKGLEIREQAEASALPLLVDLFKNEGIRFVKPVRARLRASFAGETVRIEGHLKSAVRLPCSRCLTAFEQEIKVQFAVTAVPAPPDHPTAATADEIELAANEMEVLPFTGTSIDLRAEVAQQLMLALPFTPQCSRTCQGLCNQCGANLNRSRCQCEAITAGNPFAVLRNLSLPNRKD